MTVVCYNSIMGYKYTYNENYFEIIDSEQKAYFLGLLMADGSIYNDKLTLSLSGVDGGMINAFGRAISNGEYPLYEYTPKNSKQVAYRITISNKKICESLQRYTTWRNKSLHLSPPENISEPYIKHFIRGYFDGDGHISYWYYKQSKKDEQGIGGLKYNFSITSTFAFCEWTMRVFASLGVNSYIIKNKGNSHSLLVSGGIQVQKVLDYMYKDATIYLERKHSKYKEITDYRSVNHRKRLDNGQYSAI